MPADLLRIYEPAECDAHGVPLGWDRCRACGGPDAVGGCDDCAGHGSLRVAVLATLSEAHANSYARTFGWSEPDPPFVLRCQGCGHPTSEGAQVDVRCLGWPHDLRPERLVVLCLRCWAERGVDAR